MTIPPDRNEFQPSSRERGIILTLLIAAFVVILNETILNVALPRLMAELKVGASTVQWLATAFMLTMAVVIPTTGFILQRFSTRTVFLAAMGLFSLGTLIAGMAPAFPLLLAGRVIQASGTALMLPLLITTILALVPPAHRGATMGSVSIVISVAPAIGPTLSGLILEVMPWRFLFLFVVPVALLVLVYGARRLVNVGETRATALDLLSVLLSAVGFGGVVYGFSSAGEPGGWSNPKVLVALVAGGLSLLLFGLRQRMLVRRDAPLLDLRAFAYPAFRLSVGIIMIAMMSLFGAAILLPIYLQNIRGLGSLETGLLLLPGGLLMGLALLFTPIMTSGLNVLPGYLYSHGSAIMSTLQMVSGAVGTALLVTVMAARAAGLRAVVSPELAQATGLHAAFGLAAGIAAVGLVLTFFLRRVVPAGGEANAETGTQAAPASD